MRYTGNYASSQKPIQAEGQNKMQGIIAIKKLTKCCQPKMLQCALAWLKTWPNAWPRAINNNFWRLFWILLWARMCVWPWVRVCFWSECRTHAGICGVCVCVCTNTSTNLGHLQSLANYLFRCHCAFSRQLNIFHCIQMGMRAKGIPHLLRSTKSCIVK